MSQNSHQENSSDNNQQRNPSNNNSFGSFLGMSNDEINDIMRTQNRPTEFRPAITVLKPCEPPQQNPLKYPDASLRVMEKGLFNRYGPEDSYVNPSSISKNSAKLRKFDESVKLMAFDLSFSLLTSTPPGTITLLHDSISLIKSLRNPYETTEEIISLGFGISISKIISKSGIAISTTLKYLYSTVISISLSDYEVLAANKLMSLCSSLSSGLKNIIRNLLSGGVEFKKVGLIIGFNLPEILISKKFNLFFETKYESEVREAFNSLCFPEFQNRKITEYYETIIREIYNGINLIGELPFVSLHFNNEHLLYSVMNPYYKNTLIGNLLAYLDYFLKGFVNGGFFNIKFIKNWVKLPPQERIKDLQKLNDFLIDVKKIVKQNLNNTIYKSLYDLIGQDKMTTDLTSAFRIIGGMKIINYHDSIFLPKADFSVEYDINPTPQLQKVLSTVKSENEEFKDIKGAFHKMKDIIYNVMPLIPHFRGYFVILNMITCAIHYSQSLFSSGKKIITTNSFQETSPKKDYVDVIPEIFPPLPVFVRQKISPLITFGEILECLQKTSFNTEVKSILYDQKKEFSETSQIEFYNAIKSLYKNKVLTILKDDFYIYDDEDIFLNDFMGKSLSFLMHIPQMIKDNLYTFLKNTIQELSSFTNGQLNSIIINPSMSFIQIENECRKVFNIVNDFCLRQKNILSQNDQTYRRNIEILNQNEAKIIEEQNRLNSLRYNANYQINQIAFNNYHQMFSEKLNETRDQRNTMNQKINEGMQAMTSINNFITKLQANINTFINASHSFLQLYKEIINYQKNIPHEFFISKPQIASCEDGKSIEGGCLIKFQQNPLLVTISESSSIIQSINSFIKTNQNNEEFINNKNESGFLLPLKIDSLFQDNFLFTKSQNEDFLRNDDLDFNNSNLSHLAAELNLKNYCERITEKDLISETADRMTPAFLACCNGNITATNILITNKADFGKVLPNGASPFFAAIQLGHHNIVLNLILSNANIGNINIATEIGMTPLHWAVYYNFTDIIELLLKRGASFDIGLKCNGMTPTHLACYLNRLECLSILNKFGATNYDVTSAGYNPLHISIENSLSCSYFLINNKKINLNILDPYGNTIRDIAIINGQYEIAKILPNTGKKEEILKKNKNSLEDNNYLNNSIDAFKLIDSFKSGDITKAEIICEKWMNQNGDRISLSNEQQTLLINCCCLWRYEEFIKLLSRIINFEKSPIALYAAKYGLIDWIQEIINYNGNLMIEIDQRTIFDEAIENHDHEFIKAAFNIIGTVPINVLKRIIKRSIEINDLNLMNVINYSFKLAGNTSIKLAPQDIIFSFSSVQSFIIFEPFIDLKIDFKLIDFIEFISYDVVSYLLNRYKFSNDDLTSCIEKSLNMKKYDITFLIINQCKNITQNSSLNSTYPILNKINKENQKIIVDSLYSMLKDETVPNSKKVNQLKSILDNIFNVGDIPCFDGLSLLSISGQSINCLWILKVLPAESLKHFQLYKNAFKKNTIFYLFKTILNIYEDIFNMKKAGSMFLNCLKNLDYKELDLKELGNEFTTALLDNMIVRHFYDVDDDNQSIFHIISKFKCINNENKEKIIKIIKMNYDVKKTKEFINMKSKYGEDLLLAFASSDNYYILRNLLELGANINSRNIMGENILHKIINDELSSNNTIIEIISDIIKLSPSLIIQKDRKGKTPFILAAKRGFNGLLGLMSTYFPVSKLDSSPKKSIIHTASKSNHPLTIRYIVQNLHIDVNIKSKKGYTALHYAALYSSINAFLELLSLGGNPLITINNDIDYSSIDLALMNGSEEMIDMILKTASFNFTLSSPKILPDIVINREAYNILYKVLSMVDRKLLKSCDYDGNSLISIACIRNNIKALNHLLLIGCDYEKPNFNNQNPIHICAKMDSIGCSTVILNHIYHEKDIQGAKSIMNKIDSNGDLPIHIAIRKGFIDFVVHLLSFNDFQQIDILNNKGDSPFTEALKNGYNNILGILTWYYIKIQGKLLDSIYKFIPNEIQSEFTIFLSTIDFINGEKIIDQINENRKQNVIKHNKIDKNQLINLNSIESFINNQLKEAGIIINSKFLISNINILNNFNFQIYIIKLIKNGEIQLVEFIFKSMEMIISEKIKNISCLMILINLSESTYITNFLETIKKIDQEKIPESHPLFSWIENGLISVAETLNNSQQIQLATENIYNLIYYIVNNQKIYNEICYPVIPAPVHVISSVLNKMNPKKYKKIQLRFINLTSALLLFNDNPSFSIDICNHLDNGSKILIDYSISHNFNEDIVERIIEGTIMLYEDELIDDEIKEIILKKCINILHGNENRIDFGAWFLNSMKIIHKFGAKYFLNIINIIPQTTLKIANKALSIIIKINNPEISNEELIKKGIDELIKTANELKRKQFIETRNLDEILSAFKEGTNNFVPYKYAFDGTPVIKLSDEEIAELKTFGEVLEKQTNFISISDISYEIGKNFRDDPTIENAAKLINLTRQAIVETFGINPFIVQCLTVCALLLHRINKNQRSDLKGRIAQVATGEGKSIIIAMLAGSIALTGNCVDIISSSMYLAERDAEKFKPFYEKLGLSCGVVDEKNNVDGFNFHILYSTNIGFEFALLREGIKGKSTIETKLLFENNKKHRPHMTAIVDEADNLFIDTASNSAIISEGINNKFTWVFKPIWEETNKFVLDPVKIREKLKKIANENQIKELESITDKKIKVWISSAIIANFKQKNVDYIVICDKKTCKCDVLIIDALNTGRIQYGCRWMNGLHEFIELKENIPIHEQSYTVASISHPSYFKPYEELYGLTGTLGEEIERNEIRSVYNVDTFDVPPNRKCQRIRENTLIVPTYEIKEKIIIEKTKEITSQSRPILIIVESIKESLELSNTFKKLSIKHFVLNDQQDQDEDFIIDMAGKPGAVTIATNTAGRGTDIHIDEIALRKGGLHTLIAFFPANLRVECQALGRSGRQGQKGSCQIVFVSKEFGEYNNGNETLEKIYNNRTENIYKDSINRKKRLIRETAVYDMLQLYFEYVFFMNLFLEKPESQSILHIYYPKINNQFLLDKLRLCWAEYFTSMITEEEEPSFQRFLILWNFHVEFPYLYEVFCQMIPQKLILNCSKNNEKVSTDIGNEK